MKDETASRLEDNDWFIWYITIAIKKSNDSIDDADALFERWR